MCSVDDPMIVGDGARGAVASILGMSGGRRELSGPWAQQARRGDEELFEERNFGEGRSDACRKIYATHTAAGGAGDVVSAGIVSGGPRVVERRK